MGYRLDTLITNMTEAGIAEVNRYTGNIKILDFRRFSTEVLKAGEIGTEGYNDALKAWNDAVIA